MWSSRLLLLLLLLLLLPPSLLLAGPAGPSCLSLSLSLSLSRPTSTHVSCTTTAAPTAVAGSPSAPRDGEAKLWGQNLRPSLTTECEQREHLARVHIELLTAFDTALLALFPNCLGSLPETREQSRAEQSRGRREDKCSSLPLLHADGWMDGWM